MGGALGMQYSPRYLVRFIALPGQGCAYTIGYLKILELRQRAMDQLGEQFDIQEFHNVVLGNGAVPLEILERLVQDYIDARLAASSVGVGVERLYSLSLSPPI
jgi:hypothetical protein